MVTEPSPGGAAWQEFATAAAGAEGTRAPTVQRAEDKTDVSLIVNTTKKKSGDPAHAEQMAQLMDEWGKGGDLQKGVSGIDNAGVENAKLPPALLWKMSAKRAFMNGKAMQHELATFLPAEQRGKFVEALARVLGKDVDAARGTLDAFEKLGFDAAMVEVNAKKAGDKIAISDTGTVSVTVGVGGYQFHRDHR